MYLLSTSGRPSAKVKARLDELDKTLSATDRMRAVNLKEIAAKRLIPGRWINARGEPTERPPTFRDVRKKVQ
jgi:hypothetical protein